MASVTQKALGLLALSSMTLGGCAHKSFYKKTNNDATPAPVAADNVEVYKQRDDVAAEEVIELGMFRGSAPTVDEAMDAAKRTCGDNGGSMYILNTPPFKSGNVYRVDGMCATTPEAAEKAAATESAPPKPVQDDGSSTKPV